jgi:hypothetical protein
MGGQQAWQKDKAEFADPTGSRAAGVADTEFTRRRGDFGPLAAQFATLAAQLFSAGTAADVLDRIIHAAAALVPEADFVSITLRKNDTGFDTPVTTDDLARRLDQIQYELPEGP